MNRELAVLLALCILLGTGFASTSAQPGQSLLSGSTGARASAADLLMAENITENITLDTVWDNQTHPFVRIRNSIWVMEGANLTILPDVTVWFDDGAGLYIKGSINATGAPSAKVSFISSASDPSSASWLGITLENDLGQCIFDNVVIRHSEFGISCRGKASSITNSSIEHTFYHGILVDGDSSALIRDNYLNDTGWSGIIAENRSKAIVESNIVRVTDYGIVCYDFSVVTDNAIEVCWVGLVGRGDANFTFNRVSNCMYGVQGFSASPLVSGNHFTDCGRNSFVSSSSILKDNIFENNTIGIDIDYTSRRMLETAENNHINGIDLNDCFLVGKKDMELKNLLLDSGQSMGFQGSLTAQGSVTLYDCRNITIRDSSIANAIHCVYATNTTFKIYNASFDNFEESQIYLEANATGVGFNRSVDPECVVIGGDNCLFQTFEELRVQVQDFFGGPILGARVIVRENALILHDSTTNALGLTPNMVVKDRTVTDAGVIPSPLSVEVFADGYDFDSNPQTGVYAFQSGILAFSALGDVFPPVVVSVSVENGERSFPVNGTITVRFNEPMNRPSVENAFSISGNVTGTFSWDGFNMTFAPARLDYDTPYSVVISTGAMDIWNNSLDSPLSISFKTEHVPSSSGYFILFAVIAIFALAGIVGWFILRKLK
ncbi:MAG: Ig-like domain-containing protein [Thermoplasmata archaeon]